MGSDRIELAEDNAIPALKPIQNAKWQKDLIDSAAQEFRPHVERIIEQDFNLTLALDEKCGGATFWTTY